MLVRLVLYKYRTILVFYVDPREAVDPVTLWLYAIDGLTLLRTPKASERAHVRPLMGLQSRVP